MGQEHPKLCPYCGGECYAGYTEDHGEQAAEKCLEGMAWDLALFRRTAAGAPCHSEPELGSQALASAA